MNDVRYDFDIAIIGSGLVGSCLAIGLKNSNFRIVMLDKSAINIDSSLEEKDPRPLSLTFGSKKCLHTWGIWNEIKEHVSKIHCAHISEEGKSNSMKVFGREHQIPELGYVVPFNTLHKTLQSKATTQRNVNFIKIDNIIQIFNNKEFVSILCIVGGKRRFVTSRMIVGSDGAKSICRHLLGAATEKTNNGDVAVISTLSCRLPHRNFAYQYFTKEGILAVLPLYNKYRRRLVWSMKKKAYQELSCMNKVNFKQAVDNIFGRKVGEVLKVDKNAEFPLISSVVINFSSTRSFLIGNAAHTIYPITAQGFNLGLQDARLLSRCLSSTDLKLHKEMKYISKEYADGRKLQYNHVVGNTELILKVFYSKNHLLKVIRNYSLFLMDSISIVKKSFLRGFLYV